MNKAMFAAAGLSMLVLIFAPDYIWSALLVQLGFTVGLFVGNALKKS